MRRRPKSDPTIIRKTLKPIDNKEQKKVFTKVYEVLYKKGDFKKGVVVVFKNNIAITSPYTSMHFEHFKKTMEHEGNQLKFVEAG